MNEANKKEASQSTFANPLMPRKTRAQCVERKASRVSRVQSNYSAIQRNADLSHRSLRPSRNATPRGGEDGTEDRFVKSYGRRVVPRRVSGAPIAAVRVKFVSEFQRVKFSTARGYDPR